MPLKRKPPTSSNDTIFNKRPRPSYPDNQEDNPTAALGAQPRVDPTYGQRGAFPGLEDSADGDVLFYGPASDGVEYLRMVRLRFPFPFVRKKGGGIS